MCTFVRGADKRLYVHRWDGEGSTLWHTLGRPTTNGGDRPVTGPSVGNTDLTNAPVALVAGFEGEKRLYAFVRGGDNRRHVCYGNGGSWLWTDLDAASVPPGQLRVTPSSINFGSVTAGASALRTLTIDNVSSAAVRIDASREPALPFEWSVRPRWRRERRSLSAWASQRWATVCALAS
jgi:hypothetical protein